MITKGVIENRRAYRLPFRTKVLFGDRRSVVTGNAVNISAGGIFVMTLSAPSRDTVCKCLFMLEPDEQPIRVEARVSRIVALSTNVDEAPGVGFTFLKQSEQTTERIQTFMSRSRKNFELAATILAASDPELDSLEPLLDQMHLPPMADLGQTRFYIERVLRSMDLVDMSNQGVEGQP